MPARVNSEELIVKVSILYIDRGIDWLINVLNSLYTFRNIVIDKGEQWARHFSPINNL